jgi:hypothetical protein
MRWASHVARIGEDREVYRVLVGKPEGKRAHKRPRHRCEDGIRMDVREIRCRGLEWIQVAEDRDRWRALVITVMSVWAVSPWSWL